MRRINCETCHGTGLEPSVHSYRPCTGCGGTGGHIEWGPADPMARLFSEMKVYKTKFCLSRMRWWRKHQQAFKNARRPGLKPRRRKYWEGVAEKWQPRFYIHTYRGISAGNPDAIARVQLKD